MLTLYRYYVVSVFILFVIFLSCCNNDYSPNNSPMISEVEKIPSDNHFNTKSCDKEDKMEQNNSIKKHANWIIITPDEFNSRYSEKRYQNVYHKYLGVIDNYHVIEYYDVGNGKLLQLVSIYAVPKNKLPSNFPMTPQPEIKSICIPGVPAKDGQDKKDLNELKESEE